VTTSQSKVYIIDDDPQVCESLSLLVRDAGLRAETYGSAEEFLAAVAEIPDQPACLVIDVRMPGLSGLGLQRELADRGVFMPFIMISGYADVPMAVQAMSAGALDFIEKPFSRQVVMRRILDALDRSAHQRLERTQQAGVAARVASLSAREHEVMQLLVDGKHAKQIAVHLGIAEKTVLKHRSRILEKMQVESVVGLVHLVLARGGATNRSRAQSEAARPDPRGPLSP